VWKEISNSQHLVKFEDYRSEIEEVSRQTIKATKLNITSIYERLVALKYPFRSEYPLDFLRPDRLSSTAQLTGSLRALGYSLPILLEEFYSVIGGIDFSKSLEAGAQWEFGDYHVKVLNEYYTDPLQVYSLSNISDAKILHQIRWSSGSTTENQPRIQLCPDFYLKEGVSGAGAYEIIIENDKMVNPVLDMRESGLVDFTFLDYLRISLKNGGFFGLHFVESLNGDATRLREKLTRGLAKI